MWNQRPSFRFEIDNFSKKESSVKSQTFVGGGCEWYLSVYPKGNSSADNHLSLYLRANPKSLRTGWKRKANYYFVVLDQSNKELYKSPIGPKHTNNLYCTEAVSWGYRKTLPLCKLHETGFLENDKLIIEVYINVLEALDGEDEDVSEKKETVDINGFQAFASQVRNKFAEHVVQTDYKNVLSNAYTKFSELAEEGFKLDWLKSKLDEVSLKKKKKEDDESRVQLLEERIKNLEVMESGSKMDCLKSKLEEISLERKKPYDAYGYCVQKLEERVKNLEEDLMERKKSDDADRSRIEQLEVRIKDLERMMACQKVELGSKLEFLKSKFEEDSLERKKSHDADGSRIQELEEFLEGHVQNMELVVSDLKDELDKKKDKTSAHGFLLVG